MESVRGAGIPAPEALLTPTGERIVRYYDTREKSVATALNTLHNLHYYQELMRVLRSAIESGTLEATAARLLQARRTLVESG